MRIILQSFAAILIFGHISAYSQTYETPPMLSAQSVLPRDLFNDEEYKIEDRVFNDGYMNLYTVRSRFGDAEIRSTYSLVRHLTEMHALYYLEQNYGSATVATGAVGTVAKRIVTAPIIMTKKVYDTVTDTEKLRKTVRGIPGGIFNLFSAAAGAVSDAGSFVYKTGKSVVSGSSGSTGDQMDKAADFISDQTLKFIGYNRAYRELARDLQVDPYTDNSLLHSELRRVASIKSVAHVGGKFAPGYSIPFVGTANHYLNLAERTALYDDPKEVEELNAKILETLGSGGEKTALEADAEAFFENPHYNPAMRNSILESIKILHAGAVEDLAYLLNTAGMAQSKEIAEFFVQAIGKLGKYQAENPLKAIVTDGLLPGAVAKDGKHIIPLALDYLVWTKEVAEIFKNYHSKVEPRYGVQYTIVFLTGDISPRCEMELRRLGADSFVRHADF